jgi:hypothetical protein
MKESLPKSTGKEEIIRCLLKYPKLDTRSTTMWNYFLFHAMW